MRTRKILIGFLVGAVVVILLGVGGFLLWASDPHPPMPEALASLESDQDVQVVLEPWITFTPIEERPNQGFIFYPGGLVEAEAYAPAARSIAEAGYLAVITRMPLNLAVLNSGAAAGVIAAHPEIDTWVIGGHSLGGSMAASFASQNLDAIDGLALWASYPAGSSDLSTQPVAVTSIYGTLDGVAAPDQVLAAKPLLPADTIWVPIEGGNHAQFGWYGPQEGDNPATISREEQQRQVVSATLNLLEKLGKSE
jgi:dienelactone hydrolase